MKVNFIRPPQGSLFIPEANQLHLGLRTAVGAAEIRKDDGKLVAKCLSTLMILERSNRSDKNPSLGDGRPDIR